MCWVRAHTHIPNPDCIVALANEKVASFAIPGRYAVGKYRNPRSDRRSDSKARRAATATAVVVSRKDRDRGDYPFDDFAALLDGSVRGMFRTRVIIRV